jgi:hypothetical protein
VFTAPWRGLKIESATLFSGASVPLPPSRIVQPRRTVSRRTYGINSLFSVLGGVSRTSQTESGKPSSREEGAS